MKKAILTIISIICFIILVPIHRTAAINQSICGRTIYQKERLCLPECSNSDCNCINSCLDRKALEAKIEAKNKEISPQFYNTVVKNSWFDACLATDSLVGNKISNLGFIKHSLVYEKYNYIFAELDNKIADNKSYYSKLLNTETDINTRANLNTYSKGKDDCLNRFKTLFDQMLKQKSYKCFGSNPSDTDVYLNLAVDLGKGTAGVSEISEVCKPYDYLLNIYKEAHDSLCLSSDSVAYATKKDIVDLYTKSQSYSSVGCASGYTYDQCNLACVLNTTINTSTSLDMKSGKLVKNKAFAEVFYVDDQSCLHWIINEKIAAKNYGKNWNRNIQEYDNINGYKFCDNIK